MMNSGAGVVTESDPGVLYFDLDLDEAGAGVFDLDLDLAFVSVSVDLAAAVLVLEPAGRPRGLAVVVPVVSAVVKIC